MQDIINGEILVIGAHLNVCPIICTKICAHVWEGQLEELDGGIEKSKNLTIFKDNVIKGR